MRFCRVAWIPHVRRHGLVVNTGLENRVITIEEGNHPSSSSPVPGVLARASRLPTRPGRLLRSERASGSGVSESLVQAVPSLRQALLTLLVAWATELSPLLSYPVGSEPEVGDFALVAHAQQGV